MNEIKFPDLISGSRSAIADQGKKSIGKIMPAPDKLEKEKQLDISVAMGLMREILDEFGASDFTLEDLQHSLREADKDSLDFLVEEKMLLFDEETGEYSVNHNSDKVAKMEMERLPEGEDEEY